MKKSFKILAFLFISFLLISSAYSVEWMEDLDDAKFKAKDEKLPLILWVGLNNFRQRPLEVRSKDFIELSKKFVLVNLHPGALTDAQRN